ncbi:MAG: hypothetical protein ACYDAO_02605 [Thermoplasmataceae archaeon]|jgi:hypothetical protein
MTVFEFVSTLVLSLSSLFLALWAIKIALKGNSLLMTLTKSIQEIESISRSKRATKSVVSESTKQKELQLREQKEQRKALELELRKQQQDWKRKKDVTKLIGWFLERLESDDE